jgi:hypothetical protein
MTGRKHKVQTGQNGLYLYEGIAAFAGAGLTFELDVPFDRIHSFSLDLIGAPATTDGQPSINEAYETDPVTGRRTIRRDASGNVTIQRVAGTTANLAFSFQLWGK